MSHSLSQNEINKRLTRLRNLERLHAIANKRIVSQDEEIKHLKLRIKELEDQNKEKDKIIEKMMLQLEEIKIKVFGKKKRNKDPRPPKERQKADRDSSSYQRPIPTNITKTENHPINECTACHTQLIKKILAIFYEEDIPFDEPQKMAIRHEVEKGYCPTCKKWRSSIPIPSAKCIIGQGLRKYIPYLSIILRLSYRQIEDHIKDIYRIRVSQGEIAGILHKEADKLRPEHERLKARVQKQKAKHYDESPWKVVKGNQGGYGWIMTGTETNEAVFSLGQSRGKGNIDKLNSNHNQIGITDDYGAYKNQFEHHQLCWAHLFRKFRDFAESDILKEKQKETCLKNFENISFVYGKLRDTLKASFNYEKTHKYFIQKLIELSNPDIDDLPKLKTIKESLFKNKEKYLTCLKFPGLVPPDNNKAERGLRHLVIKRKISCGSKTQKGAETTSILASVLLSLKWMNPDNFFQKYFSLAY